MRGEVRVGERSVGSVLADRLGRGRAFVVAAGAEQVVRALSRLPAGGGRAAVVCRVLGGEPLACLDVRAEAEAARRKGACLVADLTDVSPLGCAALRLGADALVAPLSGALAGHALVAVAPGASVEADLLQTLPDAREVDEALLAELLELDAAWGRASDCAQVVCPYLSVPRPRAYPMARCVGTVTPTGRNGCSSAILFRFCEFRIRTRRTSTSRNGRR